MVNYVCSVKTIWSRVNGIVKMSIKSGKVTQIVYSVIMYHFKLNIDVMLSLCVTKRRFQEIELLFCIKQCRIVLL